MVMRTNSSDDSIGHLHFHREESGDVSSKESAPTFREELISSPAVTEMKTMTEPASGVQSVPTTGICTTRHEDQGQHGNTRGPDSTRGEDDIPFEFVLAALVAARRKEEAAEKRAEQCLRDFEEYREKRQETMQDEVERATRGLRATMKDYQDNEELLKRSAARKERALRSEVRELEDLCDAWIARAARRLERVESQRTPACSSSTARCPVPGSKYGGKKTMKSSSKASKVTGVTFETYEFTNEKDKASEHNSGAAVAFDKRKHKSGAAVASDKCRRKSGAAFDACELEDKESHCRFWTCGRGCIKGRSCERKHDPLRQLASSCNVCGGPHKMIDCIRKGGGKYDGSPSKKKKDKKCERNEDPAVPGGTASKHKFDTTPDARELVQTLDTLEQWCEHQVVDVVSKGFKVKVGQVSRPWADYDDDDDEGELVRAPMSMRATTIIKATTMAATRTGDPTEAGGTAIRHPSMVPLDSAAGRDVDPRPELLPKGAKAMTVVGFDGPCESAVDERGIVLHGDEAIDSMGRSVQIGGRAALWTKGRFQSARILNQADEDKIHEEFAKMGVAAFDVGIDSFIPHLSDRQHATVREEVYALPEEMRGACRVAMADGDGTTNRLPRSSYFIFGTHIPEFDKAFRKKEDRKSMIAAVELSGLSVREVRAMWRQSNGSARTFTAKVSGEGTDERRAASVTWAFPARPKYHVEDSDEDGPGIGVESSSASGSDGEGGAVGQGDDDGEPVVTIPRTIFNDDDNAAFLEHLKTGHKRSFAGCDGCEAAKSRQASRVKGKTTQARFLRDGERAWVADLRGPYTSSFRGARFAMIAKVWATEGTMPVVPGPGEPMTIDQRIRDRDAYMIVVCWECRKPRQVDEDNVTTIRGMTDVLWVCEDLGYECDDPIEEITRGHLFLVGCGRKSGPWLKWGLHRIMAEARIEGKSRLHIDGERGIVEDVETKGFAAERGINYQLGMPFRPSSNASAEATVRIVAEIANAGIQDSCLDARHWDSIGEYQLSLRNAVGPFGIKPLMNTVKFVRLGVLGHVNLPKVALVRLKVEPRTVVACFVGIEMQSVKGVRIEFFDPDTKKLRYTTVLEGSCRWSDTMAYGFQRQGVRVLRAVTGSITDNDGIEVTIGTTDHTEDDTTAEWILCDACNKPRPIDDDQYETFEHRFDRADLPIVCADLGLECREPPMPLGDAELNDDQYLIDKLVAYRKVPGLRGRGGGGEYLVRWRPLGEGHPAEESWEPAGALGREMAGEMARMRRVNRVMRASELGIECDDPRLGEARGMHLRLEPTTQRTVGVYPSRADQSGTTNEFIFRAVNDVEIKPGTSATIGSGLRAQGVTRKDGRGSRVRWWLCYPDGARGGGCRGGDVQVRVGQYEFNDIQIKIKNDGVDSVMVKRGMSLCVARALDGGPITTEWTTIGTEYRSKSRETEIRGEKVMHEYTLRSSKDLRHLIMMMMEKAPEVEEVDKVLMTRSVTQKIADGEYSHLSWDDAFDKEVSTLVEFNVIGSEYQEDEVRRRTGAKLGYIIAVRAVKNEEIEGEQEARVRAVFNAPGATETDGAKATFERLYMLPASLLELRMVLLVGKMMGFDIEQFDISAAYLHAVLKDETYVKMDERIYESWCRITGTTFIAGGRRAWRRLERALYGHPHAGFAWDDLICSILTEMGFEREKDYSCAIFMKRRTNGLPSIIVIVYVDDGVVAASKATMRKFFAELRKRAKVKLEQKLGKMLGCEYAEIDPIGEGSNRIHRIVVSMVPYIERMREKFLKDAESKGVTIGTRKITTPSLQHDACGDADTTPGVFQDTASVHLGTQLYAERCGMPAELQATSAMTRRVTKWMKLDDQDLIRFNRYLANWGDDVLTFEVAERDFHEDTWELRIFTDTDFGGDVRDRRSTIGGVIMAIGTHGTRCLLTETSAVMKSTTVATGEAEIGGAFKNGKSGLIVLQALEWILNRDVKCRMLIDAMVCIQVINRGYSVAMRHTRKSSAISIQWLSEQWKERVGYVPSEINCSDVETKAVGQEPFQRHRFFLGMRSRKAYETHGRCACYCRVIAIGVGKTARCMRLATQGKFCEFCAPKSAATKTEEHSCGECSCWGYSVAIAEKYAKAIAPFVTATNKGPRADVALQE